MTEITDEQMRALRPTAKVCTAVIPAARAGIFVYELHPCRGFPGDALPA